MNGGPSCAPRAAAHATRIFIGRFARGIVFSFKPSLSFPFHCLAFDVRNRRRRSSWMTHSLNWEKRVFFLLSKITNLYSFSEDNYKRLHLDLTISLLFFQTINIHVDKPMIDYQVIKLEREKKLHYQRNYNTDDLEQTIIIIIVRTMIRVKNFCKQTNRIHIAKKNFDRRERRAVKYSS